MLKFADVPKERALQLLKSDANGLSADEVAARQQKLGKNELKKGKRTSVIGLFFGQFGLSLIHI